MKPEESTEVKDKTGWLCPNCGVLSPVEVTFHEQCASCFEPVKWLDGKKVETASVEREMLESFCQFRHERLVKAYREFDLDPVCESDEVLIDKFLEERAKK